MAINVAFLSINGFNKADVLDYIDAMQSRHIEEFNAAKKQIDDLHKAVNENQRKRELKANLELLNSKLILMEEETTALEYNAGKDALCRRFKTTGRGG